MNNLIHSLTRHKDRKGFAWLLDPDKCNPEQVPGVVEVADEMKIDCFLVGGSLVFTDGSRLIRELKSRSDIPVVLFPGSVNQVDMHADAILFLSLISGRNPDYLIGHHVLAAPRLKHSNLQILPTGYMLIDGGKPTSVQYMSNTTPIPRDKPDLAMATAMAGEMLGLELIYLDAGSGADIPVPCGIIEGVHQSVQLPVIVGGGLHDPEGVEAAYRAGADLVVVGNAVEGDPSLIRELVNVRDRFNT